MRRAEALKIAGKIRKKAAVISKDSRTTPWR
jgi:hypothetical protein